METYRVKLRPLSASLSRWQADTIFGHLCWALRYADGEDALVEFLVTYDAGRPPLLLSNAFPGDLLPQPAGWPPCPPVDPAAARRDTVARQLAWHDARRQPFLTAADFDRARRGEVLAPTPLPAVPAPERQRVLFKNQISRRTGTTGGEGQLYNVTEFATGYEYLSVYVRVAGDWLDRAQALFEQVAQGGYGRKKSAGYGQFEVVGWEQWEAFATFPEANGFVSLSNFVPAADDPVAGAYRRLVKYGKLGESYTYLPNPFKRPLILLRAGAAFRVARPRPHYGRLVHDIARQPGVVQYGLAFDVPARVAVA